MANPFFFPVTTKVAGLQNKCSIDARLNPTTSKERNAYIHRRGNHLHTVTHIRKVPVKN